MKKLKIGAKIWLGFSYILLFLLVITVISIISSLSTGSNIDEIDVYVGMETSANELIHILNESRITAAVFYETHSQASFGNLTKQLTYCDFRLKVLYEYIDAHPELSAHRSGIEEFDKLYTQWRTGIKSLGEGYDLTAELTGEDASAFAEAAASLRSVNLVAHEKLSGIIENIGDISSRKTVGTKSFHSVALMVVIIVSAVALVSAVGLSIIINRSITPPVGYMRDVLSQIGQTGDLKIPENLQTKLASVARGRDETAECTSALLVLLGRLNSIDELLSHVAGGDLTVAVQLQSGRDTMGLATQVMLQNLNQKFGTIAEATSWVHQKAGELSDGSRLLSDGSRTQAESVGYLSGSVTEIVDKIKTSTELAQQAAQLVDDIQKNANSGTEQMSRMTQAAQDINKASQAIAKVIKVIDDIAFQTNILALNAAVEAARAGQHGKGFSVVAEEVRSLATKSAEAAKDTGTMIEDTIQKATLGAAIAEATSDSLEKIVQGVKHSSSLIGEITTLSHEQTRSIEEIITSVERVQRIVEQNNEIAEKSAGAAGDISEQSGMLSGLVEQFKLLEPPSSGTGNSISRRY